MLVLTTNNKVFYNSSASATSSPSTVAILLNFHRMPRCFIKFSSRRSWSPGTTGLRKRALSMPEKNRSFVFFGFERKHTDSPSLGHSFNDQDTRHDRKSGKVALKKGFINGDIFYAHDVLSGIEFKDPVNQNKRITMGKNF